jgi:hypothetical protein
VFFAANGLAIPDGRRKDTKKFNFPKITENPDIKVGVFFFSKKSSNLKGKQ